MTQNLVEQDTSAIQGLAFIYNLGHIHPYFSQVRRLMFIGVNFRSSSKVEACRCDFFRSYSNRFWVILIWSSELASVDVKTFSWIALALKIPHLNLTILNRNFVYHLSTNIAFNMFLSLKN